MDAEIGDEFRVYRSVKDVTIVKVKQLKNHNNCLIIYDGNFYYLVKKMDIIAVDENEENLIAKGLAEVV